MAIGPILSARTRRGRKFVPGAGSVPTRVLPRKASATGPASSSGSTAAAGAPAPSALPGRFVPMSPITPPASGSWRILSAPSQDPNFPGFYFTEFRNPSHAQLTGGTDFTDLKDEIKALSVVGLGRKMIFELPITRMSQEVVDLMCYLNASLDHIRGRVVFFFTMSGGTNLKDFGLDVGKDKADAVNIASTKKTLHPIPNTGSVIHVFHTDLTYSLVYFVWLKDKKYAATTGGQDLTDLENEMRALHNNPYRKIVFQMVGISISPQAFQTFIDLNSNIKVPGKLVLFIWPQNPQLSMIQGFPFNIVHTTREDAAKVALGLIQQSAIGGSSSLGGNSSWGASSFTVPFFGPGSGGSTNPGGSSPGSNDADAGIVLSLDDATNPGGSSPGSIHP